MPTPTAINISSTNPAAEPGNKLAQAQASAPYTETLSINGVPTDFLVRDVSLEYSNPDGSIGVVIDGAGSVPTTGSKGFCRMPYAGTITGWTILADISGSCDFTIKKSDYSTFPTTSSIVASAKPTLSSAQKATSTTLTGWTTVLAVGDVLEFNLDSVTTCKRILLTLQITKA